MLNYSELKKGVKIVLDEQPYEIIEANFLFKGRGGSILQAKLKNLISGSIISQTLHPRDEFEEAEIKKIKAKFLYSHRDKFFFCEEDNPSLRFDLSEEVLGKSIHFLIPNQIIEGIEFNGRIVNISMPIKIQLKVTISPPGIKGNRSQSGTKQVELETGAKINAPLFIKEGDIIEVNTEKEEYVRRIE